MKVRRIGMGSVALLALTVTAACSSSGSGSGSSSSGGSGGGGSSASGGKYSIGIVEFASSDQTSEQAIAGFRAYAKKQGWTTSAVDPQGDVDKANGAMSTYVQKKVNLIVTAVFDSKTLTAGAQAAKSAGIPVVSISGGTADGITANLDAGYSNGEPVAKQLVADMGGKGDLLVLGYKSGLPCVGREQALDAALKGTSIKKTRDEVPIPGQVEASTQFAQAWLAKHPKGSSGSLAVWGCFDDPALGTIAALKSAGRKDVKVYGINGEPAAISAIKAGDMRATVYLLATQAGENFAKLVPEFVKGGVNAKPQEVALTSVLVTSDTIGDFLKKYPNSTK